jgi:hypothetical protein
VWNPLTGREITTLQSPEMLRDCHDEQRKMIFMTMIIQVTRMPILEVIQLIDDVKQYYQYKSSVHIVIFSGGPKETDAPWSTA